MLQKKQYLKQYHGMIKEKYEITWKDIEIKNDIFGRPFFEVSKIDNNVIISKDISISHISEYAIACCTIIVN